MEKSDYSVIEGHPEKLKKMFPVTFEVFEDTVKNLKSLATMWYMVGMKNFGEAEMGGAVFPFGFFKNRIMDNLNDQEIIAYLQLNEIWTDIYNIFNTLESGATIQDCQKDIGKVLNIQLNNLKWDIYSADTSTWKDWFEMRKGVPDPPVYSYLRRGRADITTSECMRRDKRNNEKIANLQSAIRDNLFKKEEEDLMKKQESAKEEILLCESMLRPVLNMIESLKKDPNEKPKNTVEINESCKKLNELDMTYGDQALTIMHIIDLTSNQAHKSAMKFIKVFDKSDAILFKNYIDLVESKALSTLAIPAVLLEMKRLYPDVRTDLSMLDLQARWNTASMSLILENGNFDRNVLKNRLPSSSVKSEKVDNNHKEIMATLNSISQDVLNITRYVKSRQPEDGVPIKPGSVVSYAPKIAEVEKEESKPVTPSEPEVLPDHIIAEMKRHGLI